MLDLGLTGLAQISGRNDISWDDKFKCDIEYINQITLKNDLKIKLDTKVYLFYPPENYILNLIKK